MGGCVIKSFKQASLSEAEFKGAKFSGEELNDLGSLGWWEEEAVNTVNDAVSAELKGLSYCMYPILECIGLRY